MEKLNKLALVLSALAISSAMTLPAHAMSRDELATVRDLVDARNAAGLRDFLAANPQVMDNSPLGRELAAFVQQTTGFRGFFNGFAARNAVPVEVREIVEATKTDSSLY